MERFQISFNQQQLERLHRESKRLGGSSVASIVRLAITEYFERQGASN
jgi:metal-responsive CopG/Arc/MetJ family transcriptional regulator